MNARDVRVKFDELFNLPAESEWVEFKAAKNTIHFEKLGKYFSALSNEANLKRQEWGWLILGIEERPRTITGPTYRKERRTILARFPVYAGGPTSTESGLRFREMHMREQEQATRFSL